MCGFCSWNRRPIRVIVSVNRTRPQAMVGWIQISIYECMFLSEGVRAGNESHQWLLVM